MYRKYSTVNIFNWCYELCFMLLVLCTAYVLKSVVYHWNWLIVSTECTLTRTGIWEYNKYCRINGNTFHCRSNISFFKMSLSGAWQHNMIVFSLSGWKKTLRKCRFLKKQSNVLIFKNISSGNILEPWVTFRETWEWERFAMLAHGVWNPDLDSFPLWINLNECPHALGSCLLPSRQVSIRVLKGFHPHPTAQLKHFYATVKIPFQDRKSISFPTPFLNSKSEQNHLLKASFVLLDISLPLHLVITAIQIRIKNEK